MATRAIDSDGQGFAAVKHTLCAQQCARYAGLSFGDEQRRLRIRLRRVLLGSGVPVARAQPPPGVPQRRKVSVTNSQLVEWKHAAVDRQASRARRHAIATSVQRRVRRWLAARGDVELPATSKLVALRSEPLTAKSVHAHTQQALSRRLQLPAAAVQDGSAVAVSRREITEPFQLIVELLGARDLALDQHSDACAVSAVVRVVHQPTDQVLGLLEAPELRVDTTSHDGVQWGGHVLQLGVDPAEDLLQGGVVTVDVSASGKNAPLGRISVALDLLETPLADQFAMTRWFPLERSRVSAGRPARGEIRLSMRLLTRNHTASRGCGDDDGDVWAPYATTAPVPTRASSGTANAPATGKKPRLGKPPLSPRKREPPVPPVEARPHQTRQQTPPPRYARVEVISPPSSPSSYSSDSNTRDSEISPQKAALSPSSRSRVSPQRRDAPSPSRGIATAAATARRASLSTRRDEEPTATTGQPASPRAEQADEDSSKKLFLKRKPHKVVFQKLDWSRVGSKTDSNWGSGAKPTSATTAGESSPRGSLQQAGAKNDAAASHIGNVAIPLRIAAVADQVYAACQVTQQSAGLAQMRYKAERKRWLQTNFAPVPAPLEKSESATASWTEAALHVLWTELHADVDGSRYVALLLE